MNPVNDASTFHNSLMLLTQSYGVHLQKLADRIAQLEQENAALTKQLSERVKSANGTTSNPASESKEKEG